MGLISIIIVGGLAGWLASMVMKRDGSMGVIANIIVGCIGSVIGNFVANHFGIAGSVRTFSITGLLIAAFGAAILLGVINLVQRGRLR